MKLDVEPFVNCDASNRSEDGPISLDKNVSLEAKFHFHVIITNEYVPLLGNDWMAPYISLKSQATRHRDSYQRPVNRQ